MPPRVAGNQAGYHAADGRQCLHHFLRRFTGRAHVPESRTRQTRTCHMTHMIHMIHLYATL